jgi:hypothetical protein
MPQCKERPLTLMHRKPFGSPFSPTLASKKCFGELCYCDNKVPPEWCIHTRITHQSDRPWGIRTSSPCSYSSSSNLHPSRWEHLIDILIYKDVPGCSCKNEMPMLSFHFDWFNCCFLWILNLWSWWHSRDFSTKFWRSAILLCCSWVCWLADQPI